MCECLEYDDRSMHLCELCADQYREERMQLEKLRGFVEKCANIVIHKKGKMPAESNAYTLWDVRHDAKHLAKDWQQEGELF